MSIHDEISFSISPYVSRVNKAIQFYQANLDKTLNNGLMLCIGEGPSAGWPVIDGTEVPPLPSLSVSQITNPIGFKRYKTMKFAVSDDAGIYSVGGVLWKVINGDTHEESISLAKSMGARWLYIEAELETSELNSGDIYYRQLGLYSGLKIRTDLVSDYSTRQLFLPGEIERFGGDYSGVLEVYQNTIPMRRPIDYRETFSWVLEF